MRRLIQPRRRRNNRMREKIAAAMMVMTLSVGGAVALQGCAVTEEIRTALFDTTEVNLADSTYAAADLLAQQTKSKMTQLTPLRVAMLTDVTTPAEVTAFGQQVSNQLGSRFVQLGYNVQSVPMPPAMVPVQTLQSPVPLAPGGAPSPVPTGVKPSSGRGEVMLTGTYARLKDTIQVSLKMLQAPDQQVIAAYDYSLPMTRDLREISMSAAEKKKREEQPFSTLVNPQ